MVPNTFSSIVGVKFEIINSIKPIDGIFYKVLNKLAVNKSVVNLVMFTAIEAFVIRFDPVSKKFLFSVYGSLSGGTVFFGFVARCLGIALTT